MKSTADILREARALIDTPDKWLQGADARTANGSLVDYTDADAVCFCAEAAVQRAKTACEYSPVPEPLERLSVAAGGTPGSCEAHLFNDDPATSHADVLAAFDRAIALAETQA